jgi:hypothetical protein
VPVDSNFVINAGTCPGHNAFTPGWSFSTKRSWSCSHHTGRHIPVRSNAPTVHTHETHGIHFWLGNSRLPGVVFEQERDALVVHNVAMLDAMSAQPDCILYRIWVGGMGRTLGSTQSIRFA